MKRVIIFGASSGIGRQLADIYAREGCALGLAARRLDLLEPLAQELGGKSVAMQMDVSMSEETVAKLDALIQALGGMDLLIISAGTGHINPGLEWQYESDTIDVNVRGFTALVGAAMQYFLRQGSGHLAAISSVAALRGSANSPAYNASKAFMSNYMEGLACKAKASGNRIAVTDIRPGFVDTAMAQGDGLFWVALPDKAARQIARIIARRKACGYVTKRWALVAVLLKLMPRRLYMSLFKNG